MWTLQIDKIAKTVYQQVVVRSLEGPGGIFSTLHGAALPAGGGCVSVCHNHGASFFPVQRHLGRLKESL